MAGNQTPTDNRGSTALRERTGALPRSLLLAAAGVLIVAVILIATVRSARSRAERAEAPAAVPAAETAAPASTAVPESLSPLSGESSSLPPAMQQVPADTSAELRARTAVRRDGFPMLSWDVEKFVAGADGRMTYTGGARTLTGIDVSEHQYDIDWNKVAADGIDFAIIRMGYRGSTAGGLYVDEYFEANMTGALKAGVDVGVYFYSQAVTPEEAREEAQFVLDHIRNYAVTFPVVFDWEIVGGRDARTYTLSRQALCECARTFCDTVSQAGYDPMIYFTQYLGYRKYILRNLTDCAFWFAGYDPQPRIAFDFDMWQYSETGTVDGIDGEVDLNLYFVR